MVEFEEVSKQTYRKAEPVEEDEDFDAGTEVIPEEIVREWTRSPVDPVVPQEVREVRETLTEVLADAEPSFVSANTIKIGP